MSTRRTEQEQLNTYLEQSPMSGLRLLNWWYRLSCPPEPPVTALPVLKETYRRAQTASHLIFLLLLFDLTSFPSAFQGTNPLLFVILCVAALSLVLGTLFNRRGHVTTGSLIVVLLAEASMASNIVTTPHGLNLSAIPLFGLLVIPLVLASAMLPIGCVFVFAGGNSAFILAAMLLLPHSADLDAALASGGIGLLTVPIAIQIVVAVITFIWVRSAGETIERLEHIALLEREMACSRHHYAEEKAQLEAGIHTMASELTHIHILPTREVQLLSRQQTMLWLLVGPLNQLLKRLQQTAQTEQSYRQLLLELKALLSSLASAREKRQLFHLSPAPRENVIVEQLGREILWLQSQHQRDQLRQTPPLSLSSSQS